MIPASLVVGIGMGCLLMAGVALSRSRRPAPFKAASLLTLIALSTYGLAADPTVAGAMIAVPLAFGAVLMIVCSLIPLFWMSAVLFFRPEWPWLRGAIVVVALTIIGAFSAATQGSARAIGSAIYYFAAALLALNVLTLCGRALSSRKRQRSSDAIAALGCLGALIALLDLIQSGAKRLGLIDTWMSGWRLGLLAATMLAASLLLLTFATMRAGRRLAPARGDEVLPRLLALMDREEPWRDEGITIGELARRIGAPEYRLRRVIIDDVGCSFRDYINGHRIEAAKEKLRASDATIAQVAFEVGFTSLSAFNRAFRAKVGTTPTDWRRNAGPIILTESCNLNAPEGSAQTR
jgi:AraC-like DNA-binding protein/uncharacterized membrane protein SirB2